MNSSTEFADVGTELPGERAIPVSARSKSAFKHASGAVPSTWWMFAMFVAVRVLVGQDAAVEDRIIDQPPFDTMVLKETSQEYSVLPLELSRRAPIATIADDQVFTVSFLKSPDRKYRIRGEAIARIILFEERVIDEAVQLTAKGEFERAFDHFLFLQKFSPNFPGMDSAYQDTLMAEAQQSSLTGMWERVWLATSELHRRNSKYVGVGPLMGQAVEQLMATDLANKQDPAARARYEQLMQFYPNHPQRPKLETELKRVSEEALALARKQQQQQDWRSAFLAIRRSLQVWPEFPGVKELYKSLSGEHPVIVVAVRDSRPAGSADMGDWVAIRQELLQQPPLVLPTNVSAGRVEYGSPFGQLKAATNGIEFTPNSRVPKTFAVADRLAGFLSQRSPRFQELRLEIGRLPGQGFSVRANQESQKWLGRLRMPCDSLGLYSRDIRDKELIWTIKPQQLELRQGPYQVIETTIRDSVDAQINLNSGDVAIVERLLPWEVPQWNRASELEVGAYAGTSVHFLVVNRNSKWLADPIVRQSLARGVNRTAIVNTVLGEETDTKLGEVGWPLSSLFPKELLSRRPPIPVYRPAVMAASLSKAWSDSSLSENAKRPMITLLCPDTVLAARTSQLLKTQLELDGLGPVVEIRTVADKSSGGDWDLMYVQWYAMDAPTAIWSLFGEGRLAGVPSVPVARLLARWPRVTAEGEANWFESLAGALNDDAVVIPLWEFREFYARHRGLSGLDPSPYSLYQSLENWRFSWTEESAGVNQTENN